LRWISDIARSVSEIEKMGIIYLDLAIDNTIKVGGTFKIIDFGVAYKVKIVFTENQDEYSYK
jgi:tRNA A-37 threonylcarbamoyl transferase component Bud32